MNQNFNAAIFTSMNLPLVILDKDYTIVDASVSFCKSRNLELKFVQGKKCYDVSHGLDAPCSNSGEKNCPLELVCRKGAPTHLLHEHLVNDKLTIHGVAISPLKGAPYFLEELYNITDLLGMVEGILPICSSCKKIRAAGRKWQKVETYFRQRSGAHFSHGLCPDCLKKLYPEITDKADEEE